MVSKSLVPNIDVNWYEGLGATTYPNHPRSKTSQPHVPTPAWLHETKKSGAAACSWAALDFASSSAFFLAMSSMSCRFLMARWEPRQKGKAGRQGE